MRYNAFYLARDKDKYNGLEVIEMKIECEICTSKIEGNNFFANKNCNTF